MTVCNSFARVALVSALVCMPMVAGAEGKSTAVAAMAEALFKEGKRLLGERQIPEACRKFESSYRIDPAPGTLLNLAMCHEQEGKLATAWGEFNESLQIAKKTNRADRLKIAREHISAIEPLLSRFVVLVPDGAAKIGITVEMDAVPLEEGAWGTAIPIDAGDHKAVVRAPKHKTWEKVITVEHGKVATVVVPQLEKIPDPLPPDAGNKQKKIIGISALSGSAVLLGLGAFLGARAITYGSEVSAECPTKVCNTKTWTKIESGRDAALASNLLIGFGVAAAGVGTFFLVTSQKSPKEPTVTAYFQVAISPERQYLGIGGAF